nr:hypothetical protein [Paenibacillus larvae]
MTGPGTGLFPIASEVSPKETRSQSAIPNLSDHGSMYWSRGGIYCWHNGLTRKDQFMPRAGTLALHTGMPNR